MSNSSNALQEIRKQLKVKNKETARNLLRNYLQQHPRDAEGWYLAALAAASKAQAIQFLERAINIDPFHEKAVRSLNSFQQKHDAGASSYQVFTNPSELMPERITSNQYIFDEAKYQRSIQLKSINWGCTVGIITFILFIGIATIGGSVPFLIENSNSSAISLIAIIIGGIAYFWKNNSLKNTTKHVENRGCMRQLTGSFLLVSATIIVTALVSNIIKFRNTSDVLPITTSIQDNSLNVAIAPTLFHSETPTPRHTPTFLPTNTASPVYTPTTRPTNTPNPTFTPNAGKWQIDTSTSSFDDTTTVILSVSANIPIEAWLDNPTPILVLRCKENRIAVYIRTGTAADIELDNNFINRPTARFRFDNQTAFTVKMSESTDGEALFFPDPISIINDMQRYDVLLFGFIPLNAAPTETTFDIRGLSNVIQPLIDACQS